MATQDPRIAIPPSLRGTFELTRELAVGGMGVLYLARDLVNSREVVFKFIAPELFGDEETQIRFINEAKLTAQLKHPNIVELFAAGHEAGLFYIIYEYLDGVNLKTLLEKCGVYPVGKALEILIKVSEGIAYAHSHKILHRDIKPENILVGPLGDWIKIIDFGIAKSMEDAQKLTQTGFIIGTPEYLSPEQAVGHKASFFSDQYAVAVLAYELLTGRLPIEEANTVDLFTKKIRGAWVPIRERRSDIPVELQQIIERAMATDVTQRYPTMDDLVRELKTFVAKRSVGGGFRLGQKGEGSSVPSRDRPSGPRRGGQDSAESSGIVKKGSRDPSDNSIVGRRGGWSSEKTKSPSPQVSLGQAPFLEFDPTTLVRRFTRETPRVVLLTGTIIPVVLALLWLFWPSGTKKTGLPAMSGAVSIVHQLDGVTVGWSVAETGKALVNLEPLKTSKSMARQGREFVLRLSTTEAKKVDRIDLILKQGKEIQAEMQGIPLAQVTIKPGSMAVDVPALPGPNPVLVSWPKKNERSRKEYPLVLRPTRLGIDDVPFAPEDETVLQVFTGVGAEREPQTLPQTVQPPGAFLKTLEERLASIKVFDLLFGKDTRVDEFIEGADWLSRRAHRILQEASSDTFSGISEVIDQLSALVGSPAIDRSVRMAFFRRYQELKLLVEMARRAGNVGTVAELRMLTELPWPVKVLETEWKSMAGTPKPQEKSFEKLLNQTLSYGFKSASVNTTGLKSAVFSLPCLCYGNGSFLIVTWNRSTFFYLWGPPEIPSGCQGVQGTLRLELPCDLVESENQVEIEVRPVIGLAKVYGEIILLPPALSVVDLSGNSKPVKMEATNH